MIRFVLTHHLYICLSLPLSVCLAVCLSVYLYLHPHSHFPSLSRTLITELIMQGGDADTNATVAGALLGCKLGYSKLPAEWLGGLIPGNVKWLDKIVNQLLNMMGL